ncbi:MAG: hypothetical protein L0Z62_41990 [Gemmataceae bacterium]|nr:hypothetical protein [Gemmataceae bacterium]
MNAIKIETTIQTDGELHLTRLPVRKGERVEAIVLLLDRTNGQGPEKHAPAEKAREEALKRLQARADASQFCSQGPYPSREELHERS